MTKDAFQVRVWQDWALSEQLQHAAFKAGYLWAGTSSRISGQGASYLVFEPSHKHIYHASIPEHQPQYGPEIASTEAFRRFKGIDFHGIDCTIPEGD